MRKTFVVTGICLDEDGEIESESKVYAGEDEETAKSIDISGYDSLELDVWSHGMIIKTYEKADIFKWKVKYDKMEEYKNNIKEKETELAELNKQYKDLLSLLDDSDE